MKAKRTNKYLFWLISALIVVILMIVAYIGFLLIQPPPESEISDYLLDDGITNIDPVLEILSFTLINQNNAPIQLSDLNGRPTLITFGFTHCPDVCPITLGEFRNIREALGEQAESLDYVFISVDGERDTSDVLDTYFTTLRVSEFVVGMTGTEDTLRTVAEPFGVEFILYEADPSGNYTVDHTAGMFLLDSDGNWIRRYRYGIRSQIIADDILAFLNR